METQRDNEAVAREAIALVAQRTMPTPLPADLEAAYEARTKEHRRVVDGVLSKDDPDLAEMVASVVPQLKKVTAPFLERFEALQDESRKGYLTQKGYNERVAALREQLQTVQTETVFAPAERRLQAKEMSLQKLMEAPAPTEKQRAAAVMIAQELQMLSPAHGLPRVAEAFRDALKSNEFGTVRVLLPHVKTLLERKGSEWYGHDGAFEMVKRMTDALTGWQKTVGEKRLEQVRTLQYHLDQVRQGSLEEKGNFEKSSRFRMLTGDGTRFNDFARGTLTNLPEGSPELSRDPEEYRRQKAAEAGLPLNQLPAGW